MSSDDQLETRHLSAMQAHNPPESRATPMPRQDSEDPDLHRRLAFLEIDETDRARLRELAPRLASVAPAFVEAFYRHLFGFEETARFLADPALVARLKQSQQSHLQSMLEADWDEGYVDRRHRVGDVHAQVGINPQVFLGAYNQYLQFCLRHLTSQFDEPTRARVEQLLSLQKAVFLDIGLTLEAYFTQATQNLRQALDLVYQANTELRQFAQLTSHDLKTPLATMANLCDEALDEFGSQMPAEAVKLIESARSRAFRMSSTIDELLSSTISLHSGEQQEDEFSSEQAMAEAIEQVRPLVDQKNIELIVAERLPRVMGDGVRIREVFYNLLSNAVKFSDKPRGRITVGCVVRNGECVFSIADNGTGIPAEELARVFVPFRRLPAHRDIPGSGLGLYFAKTIVEQQNGRIWVESQPGKGSCFYVLLKRAKNVRADS
jgi:signal transduction histidine kinase